MYKTINFTIYTYTMYTIVKTYRKYKECKLVSIHLSVFFLIKDNSCVTW